MLPQQDAPVQVVLLAAGWSRRMAGVDKRLLPWRGKPMVRHAAELYRALGLPLVVVGRAGDAALAQALDGLLDHPDVCLVANPDAGSEQGASARIGLAACALQEARGGIMFALADQPLLQAQDIASLITDFSERPDAILIPRHEGARGHPLILPRDLAQALAQAPPEITARAWIDEHKARIYWHEAEHSRFTSDVDRPQDMDRMRQQE